MANRRFVSSFLVLMSLVLVSGVAFLWGCGPSDIDGDDVVIYLDSRCDKECQQQAWANLQKKAGNSIAEWDHLLYHKGRYYLFHDDKTPDFRKRSNELGVLMTKEIVRLTKTVADWKTVPYDFNDGYDWDDENCRVVLDSVERLTKSGRDWVDALAVRERLCVRYAPISFKQFLPQAMSRIVAWSKDLDDYLYIYEKADDISDPTIRRMLRQVAVMGLARPENFTADKLQSFTTGQLWNLMNYATEAEQVQVLLKLIFQRSRKSVDDMVEAFNDAFARGLTVPDTAWPDLEMLMTGAGLDQWLKVYADSTEGSPLANFAFKKTIELSKTAEQPAK